MVFEIRAIVHAHMAKLRCKVTATQTSPRQWSMLRLLVPNPKWASDTFALWAWVEHVICAGAQSEYCMQYVMLEYEGEFYDMESGYIIMKPEK